MGSLHLHAPALGPLNARRRLGFRASDLFRDLGRRISDLPRHMVLRCHSRFIPKRPMANLIPEQDQIITRLSVADMTGQMAEIKARQKLCRLLTERIIPLPLPGAGRIGSMVRRSVYHLHNDC
jgi:hypothetical protein